MNRFVNTTSGSTHINGKDPTSVVIKVVTPSIRLDGIAAKVM